MNVDWVGHMSVTFSIYFLGKISFKTCWGWGIRTGTIKNPMAPNSYGGNRLPSGHKNMCDQFSPIRLDIGKLANAPVSPALITSPMKLDYTNAPKVTIVKRLDLPLNHRISDSQFTKIHQNSSKSPNIGSFLDPQPYPGIPSSTSRSSAGARCSTTNSTAFSLTTLERSSRSLKIASTCHSETLRAPKKCLEDSWTQTVFKLFFQNVSKWKSP